MKTKPHQITNNDGLSEVKFEDPSSQQNNEEKTEVSEFRTVLPQILASTAKNMILLDLGMTLAFPTLVIAALLKSSDDLKFTEEEASWFGSIAFICQPAGSIVSGLLFEPLGRKRAMLLVNVPHIIGWFLLYSAKSVTTLYAAGFIMGVGVGFMEAPIITYVGEISQPKWRGILTSYAGLFVTIGFLFVYFLGTATDWRTAAAICSSVPMLAILVIFQVPESPIWLLSKGRHEEAERSLCWLRGWVTPNVIKKEFAEIVKYNEAVKKSKNLPKNEQNLKMELSVIESGVYKQMDPEDCAQKKVERVSSDADKIYRGPVKKILEFLQIADLFRRQTLLPLLFVISFFFFHHSAGITGTRPFMVGIFEEFGSPLDAHWVTVLSSFISLIGNIICMSAVQWCGKRKLSLTSMAGCALTNASLFIYANWFSESGLTWLPVTLYIVLSFFWNFGLGQIPWMLTSEVFPFRGRGLASGVAAGASYILGFVFSKTYVNIHAATGIGGVFGFYCVLTSIGLCLFYYLLPETEGKTLEEVEKILENKFRRVRLTKS